MNISVVIPAYNEEKRIGPTLQKIIKYLKSHFNKYEIIVLNDCSTDLTNKIVSKYMNKKQNKNNQNNVRIIQSEKNEGKGNSIKKGILAAKYPLVLFSDADLATPIEELDKLIKFIDKYDVVIASRNMKDSDVRTKQPFYRVLLGKTFPKLVSLIVLRGFKDTQCGFKLFKTSKAKKIVSLQTLNRFAFDVEILFIAKKLGYKIKEVPVVWIDKKDSKVHPVKDSLKMFADLLRIKYNALSGKYK